MTDLTRVQLEALLDGSINDHLDYATIPEVYLCIRASSPVSATMRWTSTGSRSRPRPPTPATMIERDEKRRPHRRWW